jgi:hypothetical protein
LKSKRPPSGDAYEVLKKIGKRLKDPEGEYHFSRSATENYNIAKDIYSLSDGNVICTAFHENPLIYGPSDLVRCFRYGSLLRRITSEEFCNQASQEETRTNLHEACSGAKLIVIPMGQPYTRIDGIFCRYHDGTNLAFVAFRDPEHIEENMGVIFRNGIAEYFYEYYNKLATKYNNP